MVAREAVSVREQEMESQFESGSHKEENAYQNRKVTKILRSSASPGLDFKTDKDEGRINLEGGLGDHRSSNVHEGVKNTAEVGRRSFQGNHKCVAPKTFVSQVQ